MIIKHTVSIEIEESRIKGLSKKQIRDEVKCAIDAVVSAMEHEDHELHFLYDTDYRKEG